MSTEVTVVVALVVVVGAVVAYTKYKKSKVYTPPASTDSPADKVVPNKDRLPD